jgi:hypothetical protein
VGENERTLRAAHQDDATLEAAVVTAYDGVNDPIVVTDGVTLPNVTLDLARFTLGPVTVGGISLSGIRSLTLDFGLRVQSEGADSEIWDTHVSVVSVEPELTLNGITPEWLKSTNIPLGGKAATHANTTIYLRKRLSGGSFVPNGTAQHIALTMAGLAWIETPLDVGDAPGESTLRLKAYHDGTNAPIIVNTAAAIA